ncbi:MAG: zeta toxin family protein [bacterium]
MKSKNVYVIAGPNGSGKTTFAKKFLPGYVKCPNFVNADLIAQGLSPFSPPSAAVKAGKIVLKQIREFAEEEADFAFETTLSGKLYVNLLEGFQKKGYRIHIFFLWIPSAELAVARIKDRVADGGHNVPSHDVKRRFKRSIFNFFRLYQPLSNSWMLFNNAGSVPKLIVKMKNGKISVVDSELFDRIKAAEK